MRTREEHISEKAKQKAAVHPSKIEDLSKLSCYNQDALILALDHCIRCNTCKYAFGPFTPSCPSGENFHWESYWASGRIRIARALLTGKLEWKEDVLDPIFSCPTCGACMDNCQAVHHDHIVDIIEALRELAAKRLKVPEKQQKLAANVKEVHNPYGEATSRYDALKSQYQLPDQAEIVYFIGCTSNFRQTKLRDSTFKILKALGTNFTIVDEWCCSSPLIRTGQLELVEDLMAHNLSEIKKTGADTVITSCAGCYRTLKKDFEKFGKAPPVKVLHMTEFLLPLLHTLHLKKARDSPEKIVTYHDPCHLGHHLGYYEIPRQIITNIPGVKLVEMERNRKSAWCCGAGGGVKIGKPEFALKTSERRLEDVKATHASVLLSTCPFCKTNLSDANKTPGLDVVDIVEFIASLL